MAPGQLTVMLAALVIAVFACAQGDPRLEARSLQDAQAIDLTHPYDENTIYWPTAPFTFKLTQLAHGYTDKGYFYSANSFCTPEHGGTHLDAPVHFSEGKQTVAEIPVERLIGPGLVIDIADSATKDPDYVLTLADVQTWETKHGRIPAGGIVILRTGWASRWGNKKAYLGDDTPGDASRLHFPSFGKEAAEYLVHKRKIAGLGVDTASIDNGPSTEFFVHRVAAEANVFGLENLTNISLLPPTGATIVALPMKIARGSGGPVRIIALLPQKR